MKKFLYILFLLIVSFSVTAKDSLTIANSFYKKGQYEKAIKAYQQLLPEEYESADIYYNLGNAYYKKGETAKAILYYERALLIEPNFDDAEINLEFAKLKTVDKIDKLDTFFITRWVDKFANLKSSNSWAVWSIVLFIITLGLAFLYAFSKIIVVRKVSFYTAIFLFAICLTSMAMAKKQKDKVEKRDFAIVMTASVSVKSSPDDSGTTVFVLHEGVKVKIKNSPDVWVEIMLEDGNVGWMLSEDLEII